MKFVILLIFLFNFSTILLSQNVQINNVGDTSGMKSVPKAALEIVSINSGFLAPRMTLLQLTLYLENLDTEGDITGGDDGPQYSKVGMMIECIDCLSLDNSTYGVSVKVYPNKEKTKWIAKKMW
jgi:hypothetical protein